MIDPTYPNPAFYSESNQTSGFRFVRMTEHEGTGFAVEHKCSICESVQIEGGFSIDLKNSTPYIVCKSCHENDQWVGFCSLCDLETPDCGPNGLIEYPNHWDAPPQMNHYQVICTDCMKDSDNDMINTEDKDTTMNNNDDNVREMVTDIKDSFRRQLSSNPTLEALERIETKVDKLNEYLEARRAVTNDYLQGDITFEEADEILERINQRLIRD